MLNAFAKPFVKLVERWMPDPFIFAVFLTILTFILAVAIAGASPIKAVEEWGKGFWNLLTFAMQITLTLLTGYALAHTPLARGAFTAFAHLAKTPGAAYALTCFAAWVGSLFSWAIVQDLLQEAAKALGASIPKTAMGVAFGDQWTNMIQPFWTIPALAIAGLTVRHIMGYCFITLIWSGLIFGIGLLIVG